MKEVRTPARTPRSAASTTTAAKSAVRWGHEVPNKEEQSALKRLAILRTAAQLFNAQGFHSTSLNDVANGLHVTKPSLYYYVQSKDDILLQILQHAMGLIEPAIAHAQAHGATGLEKVELFVGRYCHVLVGDFGKCLVQSAMMPLDLAMRDQIAPSFRRIDQAVRSMLQEGIEDGSIVRCDPMIAAFSVFGALHWMTAWYREGGERSAEDLAMEMLGIFRHGFAAPARVKSRKSGA